MLDSSSYCFSIYEDPFFEYYYMEELWVYGAFSLFIGRGNLVVRRQPLIPRVLSVSDGAAVARKPFKPPCSKRYSDHNDELARRLSVRKRFVPWGSARPVFIAVDKLVNIPKVIENDLPETKSSLPPGIEPLILWESEGPNEENDQLTRIEVDPLLVCYLRPHQRYHSCHFGPIFSIFLSNCCSSVHYLVNSSCLSIKSSVSCRAHKHTVHSLSFPLSN